MKNQQDIGKIVAEKLASSNYAARPSLWEDISKTLDKKRRRRKYLLFSSLAIIAVATVGTLFLINKFNSEDTERENASSESVKDANLETLPENKNLENKNVTISDSVEVITMSTAIEAAFEESENKINTSKINSEKNSENQTFNNKENTLSKTSGTGNSISDNDKDTQQNKLNFNKESKRQNTNSSTDDMESRGFEKTTTYHYYNSEDSLNISTKNKTEFDTLLKEKGVIKEVKRDSVPTEREKDSIK